MNASVSMALRRKQTNKRKRAGRRERLRAGVEGLRGGLRRLSPNTIPVHGGARARVWLWAGAPRARAQRQKRDVGRTSRARLFYEAINCLAE